MDMVKIYICISFSRNKFLKFIYFFICTLGISLLKPLTFFGIHSHFSLVNVQSRF